MEETADETRASVEQGILYFDKLETLKNPSNSELLLSILLLGMHSTSKYSTKAVKFWEKAKESYPTVFARFKAETLKKYWNMLAKVDDLGDLSKFISINADELNTKELTIKKIVECLVEFKLGEGTNFLDVITGIKGPVIKEKPKEDSLLNRKKDLQSVIDYVTKEVSQLIPVLIQKELQKAIFALEQCDSEENKFVETVKEDNLKYYLLIRLVLA